MTINLRRRTYNETATHRARETWIVTVHYLTTSGARKRREKSVPGDWPERRVRQWAQRWETKLVRGEGEEKTKTKEAVPSWAVFAERFIREYPAKRGLKPSSVQSYESNNRLHFKPSFGNVPIDQIGTREYEILAGRPVSGSTRNKLLAQVKAMLTVAEQWGLRGPVPKYRRIKTDQNGPGAYSTDEYLALVKAAPDPESRVVLLLAGEAALRCGEITALKVGDIDFERRVLEVRHSAWEEKGKRHELSTKGRRSRTVPLTPTLQDELASRCAGLDPSDYVASGCSRPLSRSQAKVRARRAEQKVRGEAKLNACPGRLHVLRHTCATDLVHAGTPLPTVQAILGHANIRETQRYTHVRAEHLHAGMERLEKRRRERGAADSRRAK